MLTILIPAAGRSRRMRGADKLLEPVEGAPVLAVMALRALATGADVVVTVPSPEHDRVLALSHLPVTIVPVAQPNNGMADSLRAGLKEVPPSNDVMILPADMPDLTTGDLNLVIAARDPADTKTILRGASQDGMAGHPVLFPSTYAKELQGIGGDQGARQVLKFFADRVRLVPLPEAHALTDLDTPEDWEQWRKSRVTSPEDR